MLDLESRLTEQLSFKVRPEVLEQINALSRRLGASRSMVARALMNSALKDVCERSSATM